MLRDIDRCSMPQGPVETTHGRLGGSGFSMGSMSDLPVRGWRPLLVALLALSAGCAVPRAFVGEPLSRAAGDGGYRAAEVLARRRPDDLRVVVSFSGGGMRASAFAYGILEQLAADSVQPEGGGGPRRLLDEVDIVSAVSGGAVPAAYWALYGDRVFEDFGRRFLTRDIAGGLQQALFLDPFNWWRLASAEYSRGDVYAEYLDHELFRGATYADLDRSGARPFLILNATDIGAAARFEFTQDSFDLLCGDLDGFPIGRAVAASSSVPGLLTPITLRNRAGSCGYRMPAWVAAAAGSHDDSRRHLRALTMEGYADATSYGWLHLVDGALGDNLGVRAALDALADHDDPSRPARDALAPGQRLVFIAVNASDRQAARVGGSPQPPAVMEMLRLLGTVPVDRYAAETKALLRDTLRGWMAADGGLERLHIVEVDLDEMRDDPRFARLTQLPTSFNASPQDVDGLRCAARLVLAANPEYQRLLRAAGGTRPAVTGCRGS